jgi:hypothetical protein
MHIANGGYSIEYADGRTADVVINGTAVECVQVREYDWENGALGPMPTPAQVRQQVADFLADADCMADYRMAAGLPA